MLIVCVKLICPLSIEKNEEEVLHYAIVHVCNQKMQFHWKCKEKEIILNSVKKKTTTTTIYQTYFTQSVSVSLLMVFIKVSTRESTRNKMKYWWKQFLCAHVIHVTHFLNEDDVIFVWVTNFSVVVIVVKNASLAKKEKKLKQANYVNVREQHRFKSKEEEKEKEKEENNIITYCVSMST